MAVDRRRDRKAKQWRVRTTGHDGRVSSKFFATKGEAVAYDAKQREELRVGRYVSLADGRVMFGDFADQWKLTAAGRPSTRERDSVYLNRYVYPSFARTELGAISAGSVQRWVHELSQGGGARGQALAPATVQKAHQVLSKVFTAAMIDGRLAVNPCRGVQLPKVEDEEARFLTPDELVALEDALDPAYALIVPFLADTGLRIGEAAALRWRDVNTLALTVTVRDVLVEVKGALIFNPPKTRAGRRMVPMLTRETADMLDERAVGCAQDDFVFASPRGGPLVPNRFRARVWRPAIERAGLAEPQPTPHALRHTAVAHWIAAGVVDPFKIKTWAGHRDVNTIYRVYGHLLPVDATEERAALSALRSAARERAAERGRVVDLRSA